MNLDDYQSAAHKTARTINEEQHRQMIPLLGLAGEVGELLSEYKKRLRDGDSHETFQARLAEELGDVLWYLSETATQFGLSLDEVASNNLAKTTTRWTKSGLPAPHDFDSTFKKKERFPRQCDAVFSTVISKGVPTTKVMVNGKQMGQRLTDNSYDADGYRFHDVFHLACAAVLGWSPVSRRNLDCKRRSNKAIDEVEDGGRAIVTEEGVSALVFAYADDHSRLEGIQHVDYDLLKAIRFMVTGFEAKVLSTGEWEQAILRGYEAWRTIQANNGGTVRLDLDARSITVLPSAIAQPNRKRASKRKAASVRKAKKNRTRTSRR